MVWQHDAARTHPDGACCARDMANNDRGGRASDARHVVMFGEPVPAVAPLLSMTRQVHRISQRCCCVATLDDRGKVENGKRYHAPILPCGWQCSTGACMHPIAIARPLACRQSRQRGSVRVHCVAAFTKAGVVLGGTRWCVACS